MANIKWCFRTTTDWCSWSSLPTLLVQLSIVLLQITQMLFQGSPCIPLSTGFIDKVGAAAGGTVGLVGVFWGCEYVSSTTGEKIFSNYWPGSGADTNHPVKAFVYDNPMQTYVICSDSTLTNELLLEVMFLQMQILLLDASGSSTTGISSAKLAVGTITLPIHYISELWVSKMIPDNSDFTAGGIPLIVRLNNHFNSPNGGIAAGTPSTTRRIRRIIYGYI